MTRFGSLKTEMSVDMSDVRKALVVMAVEKALLDFGKPYYDLAIEKLEKECHCYLSDCYENPSCLQKVLKELFGNSSKSIIKSINKNLGDFADQNQIKRFLDSISN